MSGSKFVVFRSVAGFLKYTAVVTQKQYICIYIYEKAHNMKDNI